MFVALEDRAGVIAHRRGALERVEFVLADWRRPASDASSRAAHGRGRSRVGADGTDHLHPGLGAVGSGDILAETGIRTGSPPRERW